MTGFGSFYSKLDDEGAGFDPSRDYDPEVVFKDFKRHDETASPRRERTFVGRTDSGVVVETRRRRKLTMPF